MKDKQYNTDARPDLETDGLRATYHSHTAGLKPRMVLLRFPSFGHHPTNSVAIIQLSPMSFGGPGGGQISYKPTPPERGSFPLDHDGECKPLIAEYLRCLRRVKGMNDAECRTMAKHYLKCRMDHNLMAPDEFRNLGFSEEDCVEPVPNHAGGATSRKVRDDGKKIT